MRTSYPSTESLATEVLEVLVDDDGAGRTTTPATVAERLPVEPDELGLAVEALLVAGLAARDGSDALRLTDEGRTAGIARIRRHRLTARLLSDVIGIDWWKVHHETARWEGLVSDDVEARIVELLGDPGTCPHGNPIPGSANARTHPDAVTLADAPIGPVHVARVTETIVADDEALQLLQNCGFIPGRDAEIKSRRDGWVEVAGSVRDAALPPHLARHVLVVAR
jgi:DtxR family Mn-dependent transcriptional regulator